MSHDLLVQVAYCGYSIIPLPRPRVFLAVARVRVFGADQKKCELWALTIMTKMSSLVTRA